MFGSVFYDRMEVELPQSDKVLERYNNEFKNSNDQLLRGFNDLKKSELARARALKEQSQQSLLPRKLSESIKLSTLDPEIEEEVQIIKEAPQVNLHEFRILKEINESEERGLVPRVLFDIFQQIKENGHEVVAQCSFLQIYNEKIYDLFEDISAENPLRLREDK